MKHFVAHIDTLIGNWGREMRNGVFAQLIVVAAIS